MAYTDEIRELAENVALDLAAKIGREAKVVVMVADDRRYYVTFKGSLLGSAELARIGTDLLHDQAKGESRA